MPVTVVVGGQFGSEGKGKVALEIVRRQPPLRPFRPIEARKTDRPIDYYFQRANDLRPIRSSIPGVVKNSAAKAEEAAKSAEQAARSATRAGLIYGGVGIIALIAIVVGLHQYFVQFRQTYKQPNP